MLMGLTSVADRLKFIKQFHFAQGAGVDVFRSLVFSDATKVRFSVDEARVLLKRQTDGFFPVDPDLWVRTWVTTPLAARKLLLLQVFPAQQPEGASVLVRLHDGSQDLYWDGAAWTAAGPGDWNTEADINQHLEEFPLLPDRQFAVVLNLQTTDHEITPFVTEIRVLTEIMIDYLEDIVFRSLIKSMGDTIRPSANFGAILPFDEDVTEISFFDYQKNTPYDITDIDGVYDLTDDIDLLENLFSSWVPSTGVITLSAPLPAGNRPLVIFRYRPKVSFITHQDWVEVDKVPSLVIERLEVPLAESYSLGATETVIDKGTARGVKVNEPWRATLQFRLHGFTASAVDEMRLISQVLRYFEEHPFLRSVGLDEYYRMKIDKEFRDMSHPNRADLRAFWTQFSIYDVRMPFVSEDVYAVQRLVIDFSGPKPAHEDPIKGGERVIMTSHVEDGPVEWSERFEITPPIEGD